MKTFNLCKWARKNRKTFIEICNAAVLEVGGKGKSAYNADVDKYIADEIGETAGFEPSTSAVANCRSEFGLVGYKKGVNKKSSVKVVDESDIEELPEEIIEYACKNSTTLKSRIQIVADNSGCEWLLAFGHDTKCYIGKYVRTVKW